MRWIALAGALIAVMAGCGGQAKTVTVGSAPAATAAPSSTKTASPVPGAITSRVEKSVLPVSCFSTGVFVGTGFKVRTGVVTASHVLAACRPTATIQLGRIGIETISANDPTHDLALVTYLCPKFATYCGDPNPKPLQPESRPAYVGERLALLGIPALSSLGNPFMPDQVTVVQGTVVATNHPQVLTSADGGRELLTDAIEVASPGVLLGESGGPAVDSVGKVVGVIEGSGSSFATLTPMTDLTSPH